MTMSNAGDCRHDLTRRAISALQRVAINECGLHWMKRNFICEPFDGHHMASIDFRRKRKTRHDSLPVQMDRACTALTVITALFCSRKPDTLAQQIKKRCP